MKQDAPHRDCMVVMFCAAVCVAVGVTVIVGWHIGSEVLLAVRPGYTAVQYNTALAFLACGTGLFFYVLERKAIAVGAATFVIAVAGLTTIEYVTGLSFAVDTLFFPAGTVPSPGRMAPNTAVALLASGIAMILLTRHSQRTAYLAALLGSGIAALAVVPMAGYLAGVPTAYRWGSEKPMAVLTAGALLAFATGIMASGWRHSVGPSRAFPGWLPVPAFLFGFGVSALLAKAVLNPVHTGHMDPAAHRSLAVAAVVILLFGCAASGALAGLIALAQRAVRRSLELQTSNDLLDREIENGRRVGAELEAQRRRFHDVLNALPAYVILISPEYGVPFANRYFEERFGKSEGRRCYEYLFQRDQPCENCESFAVLKTGSPHHWEWLGPDGRNYDIHDFPFVDADGSHLILEVGADITDRKRAEQQLRKASLYARSLLEASLDPLVTISREGKITDVNQATEAATGVARDRLIGTDFCGYFTVPEKAREGYQRVFADGAVRDYPLAIRSTTGAVTDVLYNATLFRDQDGGVQGIFAAARDITERKRAEQELQRYAEELKRSNSELQEFAFVASHDLQEPLRKITAFSERLRDRSTGQLDDVCLDYLNRMHSAAGRMAALIDSLLEYSRVATRAAPFGDVDLASILLGILADLEQRIRESRANVIVHDLPVVQGDSTQLRQLLQNLLANALKFHAPGTPPCIHVRAERCQDRCKISIADNGIGFDPAYTDRIFRPFQRLHGRNEYEGSGMGLAICRKIAQRHGAPIEVTSAPGQGATFTISLPAVPERTEPCPRPESEFSLPKTMMTTTC